MKKLLFIVFLLVLGFYTKAQEKDWVKYPHNKLTVDCSVLEIPDSGLPMCYFIQNKFEYNNICNKRKTNVDFNKEIVLGIKVDTTYDRHNYPIFTYSFKQDPKTNIIHLMVNYVTQRITFTYQKGVIIYSWFSIPKPIGEYEIHVHFFNKNELDLIKVFKNF